MAAFQCDSHPCYNLFFSLSLFINFSLYISGNIIIQADWSDQFVFNVHARSISPCDPHTGIGVLFEYPACILDRADRIRLFGKLRADVASLAPPTSLHYITEQRVVRGQHALHFDCDFFSEKYVEYCFVYVSQAISGAVADVRMDCLPTLPVRGEFIKIHLIIFFTNKIFLCKYTNAIKFIIIGGGFFSFISEFAVQHMEPIL